MLAAFVFVGRIRVTVVAAAAVPVGRDGQSLFARATREKRAFEPAFLEEWRRSQPPAMRRVGMRAAALTFLPAVALGPAIGFRGAGEWALISAGILLSAGSAIYAVAAARGRSATFAVIERSAFVVGAAAGLGLARGFDVFVVGVVRAL